MIVDARGLDCNNSFRRVSNILSNNDTIDSEISVLVDSEKDGQLIKGFAEIVLGCDAEIEVMKGLYFIKIAGHPCMASQAEKTCS